MYNRFLTKCFLLIGVLLMQGALLFAQGDPGTDPDVKVPFDGGLSLLIAAGVGYGLKKANDKRKQFEGEKPQDQK